ncbi:phospholipid/cholesterol/gamma-HCH transport system substrate-binding protein [Marmoricola sp. OAE513]|uniref:MCE family protein n=1 Tax=Marmoricola sp. OAE513 TaxID=2817894 RepID=UPI001AE66680
MKKLLAAVLATAALTGCGYRGASSLPLPGGVGGETYELTVTFADATNLVARETCRTNDTVVGDVKSVKLDKNLQATVVCKIKKSVSIPANAVATLRETSLLGERFVSFDVPPGQEPEGRMAAGSVVPASATRADPDVELVFGALSQVLNGGNLGSLQTITRELGQALETGDLRRTIDQLGDTVGHLNDRREDITSALEALDRLSGALARQRQVIGSALDTVPAGLEVLDRQRPALVKLLENVDSLSDVVVPLIARSKADTVADLKHLTPVLDGLAEQGDELAVTVERIVSFPFPSNGLSAIKGDYGGMYATFTLDIDSLNSLIASYAPKSAGAKAPAAKVNDEPAPLTGLGGLLSGLGLGPALGPNGGAGSGLNSLLGLLGGGS